MRGTSEKKLRYILPNAQKNLKKCTSAKITEFEIWNSQGFFKKKVFLIQKKNWKSFLTQIFLFQWKQKFNFYKTVVDVKLTKQKTVKNNKKQ